MLVENLPEFLREGPLLIDFKDTADADVKSAIIATLSSEFCKLDDIPVDNCDEYNIWAWNIRQGTWTCISIKDIDTVQNWPPQES
jgi:hypothetical protein